MPFRIAQTALAAVYAHARSVQPAECCGLLIGDGSQRIFEAVRAGNLAERPTRFLIDPKDHIAAMRHARGRGLEVLGFYHSHPSSPAWPSPTDVAEAAYPDAVHLIVSLTGNEEARLFHISGGDIT